jgi:hypothetical protein
MSPLGRRQFLRHAAALSGGALIAPSLAGLSACSNVTGPRTATLRPADNGGYGALAQSTECPELWIPPGFRAVRLSQSRQASLADPDFIVPNGMDGMAAFPLRNGRVRLIRNHELSNPASRPDPLGSRPYDRLASGGTVSLEVEIAGRGARPDVRVLTEYVSLGGTHVNCAGGPTPWGSWLSCEESTNGLAHGFEKPHGYIFEVPVAATGAVDPVPLRDMGRFVHEAVAVDPDSGVVYETEDAIWNAADPAEQPGSGFYRFIPREPGRLAAGGRLQVMAVRDRPAYATANGQRVGEQLPVHWLDIDDPDPPEAETDPSAVFRAAHAIGAASFQRLEGCFWADDSCYFVSTSGGDARAGQVWRYVPNDHSSGTLILIFESPDRSVLDSPDNICVTRRGGIIICEDGGSEQFVRGLTPTGSMIDLVMQPHPAGTPNPTEFAGCCFSPDGDVLFFNVQGSTRSYLDRPGATYALWGPWQRGAL